MPGGLLQLTAIAKEDAYIHVNPQISFFMNVYRRYSNFSKITFEIAIDSFDNDTSLYDRGVIAKAKIPKNGDLIKEFFIKLTLPKIYCDYDKYIDVKWIDDLQYKIIQNIEFSMGGRKIQEFDSEFLYSYYNTKLNNNEYNTFMNCTHKQDANAIDISNSKGNYDNINKKTDNITNKFYNKGSINDKFSIVIPIPVWFTEIPFPIQGLRYMDINITIRLAPLKELVLYREKQLLDYYFTTRSKFDNNRDITDETLLNGYLCAKNIYLVNYYLNYNADMYSINNTIIDNADVIDCKDFNFNNSKNKQINLNSSFIKHIPYYVDNFNNKFRKANISITYTNDNQFNVYNIIDSGIGYYTPPPYDSKQNITPYYHSYTTPANGYILDFIFSEATIKAYYIATNNEYNFDMLKMQNILLNLFPKLTITDDNGNKFNNIIRVSKIDILGQIKECIIDNGQIGTKAFTNNKEYTLELTKYKPSDINIEFVLFNKKYNLEDTIYNNNVTENSINNYEVSPLVGLRIKNKGSYFIGSPDIYIYGDEANFNPKINFNNNNNGTISINSVNINNKTPLGFTRLPKLKVISENENNSTLSTNLGIFSISMFPYGLFKTY